MDFEEIAKKCSSNEYRIVEEFKADCQLLVHNVAIFHGGRHFIQLMYATHLETLPRSALMTLFLFWMEKGVERVTQ